MVDIVEPSGDRALPCMRDMERGLNFLCSEPVRCKRHCVSLSASTDAALVPTAVAVAAGPPTTGVACSDAKVAPAAVAVKVASPTTGAVSVATTSQDSAKSLGKKGVSLQTREG